MFSSVRKWGDRLFPERQILVRTAGRVSYVSLTHRAQVAAAGVLMAGTAAVAYLAVDYVHLADKQAQVAEAADLRQTVANLEAKLMNANGELEEAQNRLSAIGSQYGTLRGSLSSTEQQLKEIADARARLQAERAALEKRLGEAQTTANAKAGQAAQLARNLEQSKSELQQTEAQRASMSARIRQLENEVQIANARASEYKASLESTAKRLEQLGGEREGLNGDRDRIAAEREALKRQLREIESRLTNAPSVDPAAQQLVDARPSPAFKMIPRRGTFADIESLVASTGLDVENLIARLGRAQRGEGGPYIAFGSNTPSAEQQAKREETLNKLLATLPLAAPLAQYQTESPFGPRIDPFNRRPAFHAGLDLAAPFRSPVYSTAPGIVTFTGVRDNYGKLVEINHGMGIVTRYAHLHRIMVARGQKVAAHQQIGQLGSTGRSTGPHVHYEVRVDGDAVDPEKFMQAGKNVVQVNAK